MKKKVAIVAVLAVSAATALFAAKVPPASATLTAACANTCSFSAGSVLTFQGTGFSGSQVLLVVTPTQGTALTPQITAQVNNGTIATGPEQQYFPAYGTAVTYELTPYTKSGKTFVVAGPAVQFTVNP